MDLTDSSLVWLGTATAIIGGTLYYFCWPQKPKEEEIHIPIIKPLNSHNKKLGQKILKEGIPLKILYYSQTGTAEDFSHRLCEELSTYGFGAEVCDVESYNLEDLKEEKTVIFVTSTYGEGDPPDNAIEFHRWLMSAEREEDMLSSTKFAVFGLGNKTYDHFNKIGKDVDSRLEALGATRIFRLGLGDDDANIEKDFLSWKKEFGVHICKEFGLSAPGSGPAVPLIRRQKIIIHEPDSSTLKGIDVDTTQRWKIRDERPKIAPDQKTPLMAQILVTKELHSAKSDRSCLHVEISTDGLLSYHSGDHLGLYPENDLTMVHKLCAQLKTKPETIISVHNADDSNGSNPILGPNTLKSLLLQYYDIASVVRKAQLRVLAMYAKDESEKKRLLELSEEDPDKQEIYDKYIVHDCRCITEILKEFKSVEVPLDHFLEVLPKLQPRYYSISSSPLVHPDTVHLTAVLVDYVTPTKRAVKGVTTNWLQTHRADPEKGIFPRIPAFIRKSNFKLPSSSKTPIIMVGPGTGLAPFRGFIQERALLRSQNQEVGETIFFFGCRHPDIDYIYHEELEKFVEEGAITKLIVAFSRLQKEKVYVQHKMTEPDTASHIWKLLESGAHFYVCGDARLMARDVSEALQNIVMKCGGVSKEESHKYIDKMLTDQRYLSDVWS